jgi:hypothetical protein
VTLALAYIASSISISIASSISISIASSIFISEKVRSANRSVG